MKFEKKFLDNMERCYSSSYINRDDETIILLASEAIDGPCYAYSGDDFEVKETVWDAAGGTMNMVRLPGRNGEFLATHNFFPGFNAKESKVVWVRYQDGKYVYQDFASIPYLHRFDLLEANGKVYFIGASLCTSKKDRNDWSDPGKIFVAEMPTDLNNSLDLKVIQEGLTKNHGYWRGTYEGKECGFVTSDEGIFVAIPPQADGDDWEVINILEEPISDVAVFDLDGDGEAELVTIGPFHGNEVKIRKKINGVYETVWECDRNNDFAHAIWAGELCGTPAAVIGNRREDSELYYLQYNKETGKYDLNLIDAGAGTANVAVVHQENRDILIAANHSRSEAALYYFEK